MELRDVLDLHLAEEGLIERADSPAAGTRPTFLLVQALRGLAAAWVVLFHAEKGGDLAALTAALPGWIVDCVFRYGSAGVAIFFVLSGFVISHSLMGRALDGRGLAQFALRRSIRLDPPYWAAIVLTIVAGLLVPHLRGAAPALPAPGALLAHLLYLQELLGVPELNLVFWSLTYEVQFYLVLSLALYFRTIAVRRGVAPETVRGVMLATLGLPAFVAAAVTGEWVPHGLFLNLWHGFFAGVLAYEAGYRRRTPLPLLLLCALLLVTARRADGIFDTPAALAALGLFIAGRSGYLVRGLRGAGWQFLGRISYSLYLVHMPCLVIGFGLWHRLAGHGAVRDAAGLAAVIGGCLVAAALFWRLVERPSHALAQRLRLPGRADAVPAL